MSKATATYHAPKGDNRVVEMRGVTFFDGQAAELDTAEHAGLIAKLRTNQHFEVVGGDDIDPGLNGPAKLEAKHKGRGVYAIVRGVEVFVEGLTKDEATAFNELDDEGKSAYVQKALAEESDDQSPPAA